MQRPTNQLLIFCVTLLLVRVTNDSMISAVTSTGNLFYGGVPGMVNSLGRETVTVECQGSSASQTIRFNNSEGIKAVLAESYERIHRSNLVGMGVIPLLYMEGQNAASLGLTGRESSTINLPEKLTPGQVVDVKLDDGRSFQTKARFDTDVELIYFNNGGILNYMIRKMLD